MPPERKNGKGLRVFTLCCLLAIGIAATAQWSRSRSLPRATKVVVGSNPRFPFDGYLPSELPADYSLIRLQKRLIPASNHPGVTIVGAIRPDGSIVELTTIEDYSVPTSEWMEMRGRAFSTFTGRSINGQYAVIQEEFETEEKEKRFETSIWLDLPGCAVHINSPSVVEPETAISKVPGLSCVGGHLSVSPADGRRVLFTSRRPNAPSISLIYDDETHSGRFHLDITYNSMSAALSDALLRLTARKSTWELPPLPKRFAGQSTIITAQEDGSSTSYEWKVGTVLLRVVAIDSAQRHAPAFIESIRPVEQQTFIDLLKSLSSEPPPRLQSYVPQEIEEPTYSELLDDTVA